MTNMTQLRVYQYDTIILICLVFTNMTQLLNNYLEIFLLQPKLLDEKQTTIYKRAVDRSYHLKMKASRFIYSEISQNFPIMPFSAR